VRFNERAAYLTAVGFATLSFSFALGMAWERNQWEQEIQDLGKGSLVRFEPRLRQRVVPVDDFWAVSEDLGRVRSYGQCKNKFMLRGEWDAWLAYPLDPTWRKR
jgi:hypothetical protein